MFWDRFTFTRPKPVEWKQFVPCAIYYEDADFTELVIADTAIVWSQVKHSPEVEVGHDMDTGDLVAVRIYNADHTKR